jgi:hypothetical protein
MNKELTIQEIREQGIGSNFKVANQADGFRKDNTVWFGTCTSCGERISNSFHSGKWMHEEVLDIKYHTNGQILSKSSRQLDYCPTSEV